MKKFLYAKGTKAAAACFVAACMAVVTVLCAVVYKTDAREGFVYRFESTFAQSRVVAGKLNMPFILTDDASEWAQRIIPDDVEYLVMKDGAIISNNAALTAADFEASECYVSVDKTEGRQHYKTTSEALSQSLASVWSDMPENSAVYARLLPTAVEGLYNIWLQQSYFVCAVFWIGASALLIAVLLMVYLFCVCGRREPHGAVVPSIAERLWTELRLGLFCGSAIATVLAVMLIDSAYDMGYTPPDYMIFSLSGAAAFGGTLFCEAMLFSLVRDVKNNTFWAHSIILRLLARLLRYLKKLLTWMRKKLHVLRHTVKNMFAAKTGRIFAAMFIAYNLLCLLSVILLINGTVPGFFIGLAAFVGAFYILGGRAHDLEALKRGVAAIKSGQTHYPMPLMHCEDYQQLSDDIETLGAGLAQSAAETLRAERMKTELITNVSHDLKTPLTSIINYTRLLQQLKPEPREAADYVNIIAQKSERLKQLTSDLFDIAKVQSGNEAFEAERLDAALLLEQSLAEYEEAFSAAGLTVQLSAKTDIHFMADGKKMSRVMGNLLGNAAKYALSGTRVFISAAAQKGRVLLEIKNTSAYPLDFDTDEITERFVRGSKSRTEEGNGLGLAIAKSYTEACGGRFAVVTDGDLFKVQMEFAAT